MNLPKPSKTRPFVFLSAAISLDGKIATNEGDTQLSNSDDWKRVHRLRADSDAIMVGSGTIKADDSKLTVNESLIDTEIDKHPIRVVVSSDGKIPLKSRVITHRPDILTIIATTSQCSLNQRSKLEKRGCQVIECGKGPLTDLHQLLFKLKTDFEVEKLMVEGGSRLNGELINLQLLHEIQLALAPVICGQGIPLFNLLIPFSSFIESPFFEIKTFDRIGDMIWLCMSVHYQSRRIV
ncbi:MAG: dihydrofolate reductase family protein [Candidatus Heimdallarchaeota archaeon]|nr:MAG: dihydrofolate reductase family protein [Candidatus Heimdallarchaeota archaeon]